jgi:hypothetical protein
MNHLRDNFQEGGPVCEPGVDWFNTVARWLNTANVNGGFRTSDPYNLTFYLPGDFSAAETSSEPWMLGYTLSGGNVTLTAGYVFWGLQTLAVSEVTEAVTDGKCWGIEVTYSDSEWHAEWVEKSTVTAFVDSDTMDEEAIRLFYYQFALVNGVAVIQNIGARGNWKIPAVFAPDGT